MVGLLSMVIKRLDSQSKRYIYGAGDVAREVYFCLSKEPYCIMIDAFIISDVAGVETGDIDGIPIVSCENNDIERTALVIVAVLEKYSDEICKKLDMLNMTNRVLLTFESDIWSEVREKSFYYYCKKKKYPFCFVNDYMTGNKTTPLLENRDLIVYVTRSIKDKVLKQKHSTSCWEKEIFAGSAIDNDSRHILTDDKGDNISVKNRKYCELTVMYWIWKNTDSEYIGLSHYRRRFDEEVIELILKGNVDCILTIPMINVPSVSYMYGKNHDADDWIIMRNIVTKLYPDYLQALDIIENSNYYVPYNMFIMKRNVFDKYCTWLFPILEECEKEIGDKIDVYQNRYIGFLAERLMTVYFYRHKDDLRILFCNKLFLQ